MRDAAAVIGALLTINALAHFLIDNATYLIVPMGSVVVVAYLRWRGFTWHEMGLARGQVSGGLKYAVPTVIAVAVIAIGGALLPFTRSFYLSDRYDTVALAVWSAFVVIPLQTVIPEELLFRGALDSSLTRIASPRVTYVVGAILFGLWHIASSTGLAAGNEGLTELVGSGLAAKMVGIVGAVVITSCAGLAFIWLRRRSDSLLAPISLHWALNGTGALGAAIAWQLSG
ncbi:CPBP family intramembrane glutamic endopeptidase [Williamsia sp. D3]|uniref:CPBP family intramembrane glutamic endopeptidase n=1 Tax=Williamsia sp. D3 TaxID=1313067 RepID=UPI0003D38D5C|nr:CPBP family intramembrane glutamic endopeptidase [Williamsia sp. D3]ETD31394.1 abortive infection protein [Williamsia sp. D3]